MPCLQSDLVFTRLDATLFSSFPFSLLHSTPPIVAKLEEKRKGKEYEMRKETKEDLVMHSDPLLRRFDPFCFISFCPPFPYCDKPTIMQGREEKRVRD